MLPLPGWTLGAWRGCWPPLSASAGPEPGRGSLVYRVSVRPGSGVCPEVMGRLPGLGPRSPGAAPSASDCGHTAAGGHRHGQRAQCSSELVAADARCGEALERFYVERGSPCAQRCRPRGGRLLGGHTGHRQQEGAPAWEPDPALGPLCLRPAVLLLRRFRALPARSFPSTGLSSQERGDRTGSSGHLGAQGLPVEKGHGRSQLPHSGTGPRRGCGFTPGASCPLVPRLGGRPGHCLGVWGRVWTPAPFM